MKDKKLTESEYSEIYNGAHRNFLDKSTGGSNYFHVRCIVLSFLDFTKKHGLTVKDGQLIEKSNEQEK